MDQYEQLRRFLEEMIDAVHDGHDLIEHDAKRARRALRALDADLRLLDGLLEAFKRR